MKMQLSTAVALRDELDNQIITVTASSAAAEIELTPVAEALIRDAVERDALAAEIAAGE